MVFGGRTVGIVVSVAYATSEYFFVYRGEAKDIKYLRTPRRSCRDVRGA